MAIVSMKQFLGNPSNAYFDAVYSSPGVGGLDTVVVPIPSQAGNGGVGVTLISVGAAVGKVQYTRSSPQKISAGTAVWLDSTVTVAASATASGTIPGPVTAIRANCTTTGTSLELEAVVANSQQP